MTIYEDIVRALLARADPLRAAYLSRFFKTAPGEYAAGDVFLGLAVPQTRALVKRFWRAADWEDLDKLFACVWHEARLLAALILVEKFERRPCERKQIADFYTAHLPRCNNWDLIDLSAYKILGAYLYSVQKPAPFYRLARSRNLWLQRAAVVGTMYWVKRGEFKPTLDLAEEFCTHKHDLIHKACGWLLREVGKKDERALCAFLDKHAAHMPRTMLRYALERLSPVQKKFYMGK